MSKPRLLRRGIEVGAVDEQRDAFVGIDHAVEYGRHKQYPLLAMRAGQSFKMNGETVLIALGSNLAYEGLSGADLFREALRALHRSQIFVRNVSSVWETAPWPEDDPATRGQPNYMNAIAACDTADEPDVVFTRLLEIERRFGRERRDRWQSRTLDLDLIDAGGRIGRTAG